MLTLAFRPGRFVLQVSPDEMELTLAIYPPGGVGEEVTEAQIRSAIKERKIRVNIDEPAISQALLEVAADKHPIFDLVIARGRPAEPGVDAVLDWRIPAVQDEEGFWNLDPEAEALIVEKGHVLAKATESLNGSPGLTVLGRPLPSSKGKPCPIATGPAVRRDAQGQFLAMGRGRVALRRNILAVMPFEPARAELNVDAQKTRAELVLLPPIGEAAGLTITAVEELLAKHSISFCVDFELIHAMLDTLTEKKKRVTGVVSVGVPPLTGRPGFLDVPVQDLVSRLHAGEQVDHKERSAVRRVRAGETVGIWYPADPGSPGIDVTGRELAQPAVNDTEAEAGPGVEREGPIYRATRDGHLVVSPHRLSVEDVYHVKGNLTLAVGNIRHNGTVIIDGSVGDNFIVQAEGELVVRDNLGGSEATATGNVRVGNGFIGRQRGVIRAGGDVHVKFVEQARITARGTLRIQQNALQARLESEGLLEVMGARAGIVGGSATARGGLRLTHAGSAAAVPTVLRTGFSPALDQRAAFLDEELQRIQADLAKLEQLELALVEAQSQDGTERDQPGEVAEARRRILASRLALKTRLKDVGLDRVRVARDRQSVTPAEIVVTGTAHPGVVIVIGQEELHLNTTLQSVRFHLDERGQRIKFSPIH